MVFYRPDSIRGSVANGFAKAHPVNRYLRRMRMRFFLFPVQRSQSPVIGSGLLFKGDKKTAKWFVICPNMCLDANLRHAGCAVLCPTCETISWRSDEVRLRAANARPSLSKRGLKPKCSNSPLCVGSVLPDDISKSLFARPSLLISHNFNFVFCVFAHVGRPLSKYANISAATQ